MEAKKVPRYVHMPYLYENGPDFCVLLCSPVIMDFSHLLLLHVHAANVVVGYIRPLLHQLNRRVALRG